MNKDEISIYDFDDKPKSGQKISDRDIVSAYIEHNNIWKAAEQIGCSGQTVQRRLAGLGIGRNNKPISEEELNIIRKFYEYGFKNGDGSLKKLSAQLGRTISFISRKAKDMGLSSYNRKMSESFCDNQSKISKKWHKENEHPKGYEGRKHNEKTKELIGIKSSESWSRMTEEMIAERTMKAAKTSVKNGTWHSPRHKTTWKQGWRDIGGKKNYYRSRWEANYARYLDWLKSIGEIAEWEHEPKTFWFDGVKRGVVSYLPDFKVTENNGVEVYHEVKGWMDDKSKTKIKRMKKYHPSIPLIVIDSKAYKALAKIVSGMIEDWEQ